MTHERVRLHRPTVLGRLRADRGLLLLIGLVVALTTALLAAVSPLTERTADRAVAETVREAGSGAAVVATLPQTADRRRPAARPGRGRRVRGRTPSWPG